MVIGQTNLFAITLPVIMRISWLLWPTCLTCENNCFTMVKPWLHHGKICTELLPRYLCTALMMTLSPLKESDKGCTSQKKLPFVSIYL